MTDKKEIFGKSIIERCLLMVRSEAEVACGCPELGEEVYEAWVERMDASRPEDYYILDLVEELALKYLTSETVVKSLFETIRQMILEYDELIDRV
jgi:hypothetical protein